MPILFLERGLHNIHYLMSFLRRRLTGGKLLFFILMNISDYLTNILPVSGSSLKKESLIKLIHGVYII